MNINDKELFCHIYTMLQENYWRTLKVDSALEKLGLYVDDEENPMVREAEYLLDHIFDFDESTLAYIYDVCYCDPAINGTDKYLYAEEIWDSLISPEKREGE